jgi:hypothetical protein
LGVDGYNPSVGAKADPSEAPASAPGPAVAAPAAAAPAPAAVARSSTAPGPASLSSSSSETKESALQKVDGALATISRYRTGGDGGHALKMLILYVKNIVEHPSESK